MIQVDVTSRFADRWVYGPMDSWVTTTTMDGRAAQTDDVKYAVEWKKRGRKVTHTVVCVDSTQTDAACSGGLVQLTTQTDAACSGSLVQLCR